jgi:hypothetical protein
MEIDYNRTNMAQTAALVPGVRRIAPRTVRVEAEPDTLFRLQELLVYACGTNCSSTRPAAAHPGGSRASRALSPSTLNATIASVLVSQHEVLTRIGTRTVTGGSRMVYSFSPVSATPSMICR